MHSMHYSGCRANNVRTSTSQHDTHYCVSFGGPASYMRASTALHDIHSDMSLQSRITCNWCRFMWTNEPYIVSHWMRVIICARAYTTHTMATMLRQFRTHQIKCQHIVKSNEPRLPNIETTNTQTNKQANTQTHHHINIQTTKQTRKHTCTHIANKHTTTQVVTPLDDTHCIRTYHVLPHHTSHHMNIAASVCARLVMVYDGVVD